MCPLKEGKKLAQAIDNSEVEVIKNCGHMILLEEADQALSVLKGFIKENHPPCLLYTSPSPRDRG